MYSLTNRSHTVKLGKPNALVNKDTANGTKYQYKLKTESQADEILTAIGELDALAPSAAQCPKARRLYMHMARLAANQLTMLGDYMPDALYHASQAPPSDFAPQHDLICMGLAYARVWPVYIILAAMQAADQDAAQAGEAA